MGVRFSKSIKLGKLVKLNISKSGISATIGKKGASINLGGKGTYLNLSPAIAGISGTGLSYRKKLSGGYQGLLNKLTNKDKKEEIEETKTEDVKEIKEDSVNIDEVLNEYENSLNECINVHKYSDKVLTKDQIKSKIENEENNELKAIFEICEEGDEDTIESLVGSFLNNFDFAYPVSANYELEGDSLYIDLDLPEIEELIKQYPDVVKDKIVYKNKNQSQIKQEYALTITSLSTYLAASFFNLSSTIENIIISGFTTLRNNVGEKVDEYLYSIKYTRNLLEETDLENVDDIFAFIDKFENRINLNKENYSFKSIKPYEMPSVEKANSQINDAVAALKELGYKNALINQILPKLNQMSLESTSDYVKEALKLLSELK